MIVEMVRNWTEAHPFAAPWAILAGALLLNGIVFMIARNVVARGLITLSQKTKNKNDDILVRYVRPYRLAWIAPLLFTYYLATWVPAWTETLQMLILTAIVWLSVLTFAGLLTAINQMYEASSHFRGVSIQGYLDLGKLLILAIGVILTISQITGKSPVVLLSGIGAITAILLIIFHDTLLSLVASLQIQSHDLVREGDWIEMEDYDADGIVQNIALHTVKVQNWDNTITVVPTHKLMDTPYRNWRGMSESGGRRIKRAIYIDLNSVAFCDADMIARFNQVGLVKDYLERHLSPQADGAAGRNGVTERLCSDLVCEEHQLTNIGVFRAYMSAYLKSRPDLHQTGEMVSLVRELDPGPTGLPLEVYAFTRTVAWEAYEAIQADIFEHLVAAAPQFRLRVFQQPTGRDFRALADAPE